MIGGNVGEQVRTENFSRFEKPALEEIESSDITRQNSLAIEDDPQSQAPTRQSQSRQTLKNLAT